MAPKMTRTGGSGHPAGSQSANQTLDGLIANNNPTPDQGLRQPRSLQRVVQGEQTLIAVLLKNSVEEIRVSLCTFKGGVFADIRIFASFDGEDERKPTKKGVSVRLERLGELVLAQQDAATEAVKRGLLPEREYA